MQKLRALVISDENTRRDFLSQVLENSGYVPVWYPNILAYRLALKEEEIHLIVADLSIPIEPKIDIIIRGAQNRGNPRLITIGKIEFLKSKHFFKDLNVHTLKNIYDFPEIVK